MVKCICTDIEKRTGFRMDDKRKVLQDSLQKSAYEVTAQLAVTMAKNTDLEKMKQV